MRGSSRRRCWLLLWGHVTLAAQGPLPVPSAEAVEAVRVELLDELASLMVEGGAPGASIERLLVRAECADLAPALRYALAEHAGRCARAAGDVGAGLRVADLVATVFAIPRDAARETALRRFGFARAVTPQVLAGAWLAEADRLLEGDGAAFRVCLEAAARLTKVDSPPGLAALVTRAIWDRFAVREAHERCVAAPQDEALRGRYRAFYRGDFAAGLSDLRRGDNRPARVADAKRAARENAEDPQALAMVAERWISVAADQADAVARANVRRHALDLLGEVFLATTPHLLGNETELSEPELRRLHRLFDRASEIMAEGGDAFVQRFHDEEDLRGLHITNGEWRVEGGALVGRSTGEATRATLPWAWRKIQSVTIRGGIRSKGNLNFRVAVGSCNAILNWELDDTNPIWVGDVEQRVGPRALGVGREHAIHVRQLGEWIGVFVDERLLTLLPGTLAGTVSVYPALGSEIAVREVAVIGDLDLTRVVTGPSGTAR